MKELNRGFGFDLQRLPKWFHGSAGRFLVANLSAGICFLTICLPVSADEFEFGRRSEWSAQAAEINSARVRLMHRNGLAQADAPTWDDLQERINNLIKLDRDGGSGDVRSALEEIVNAIKGPRKPAGNSNWLTLEIVVTGNSVRNRFLVDDERVGELAFHGGISPHYFPNFSEAIVDPGKSPEGRFGVSYMRPIPGVALWKLAASELDGIVAFEAQDEENGVSLRLLVDDSTSIQLRYDIVDIETKVRGGLTNYPGDVIAPSWGLDASRGRDGRVRKFAAFVVESAEFNVSLSDADFAVVVPEGTRVIDRRNPDATRIGIASREDDVVRLAAEMPLGELTSARNSRSSRTFSQSPDQRRSWPWLILVNLSALVFIAGLFILKRGFRKSGGDRPQ
ncbi:MAG: hypothetical protein ACK5Q5_19240 [Planctomycetaceae bacterium]